MKFTHLCMISGGGFGRYLLAIQDAQKAKRDRFDRASDHWRFKMRTKALTIAGVLLIAGSSFQIASASEKHVQKAQRGPAYVQDPWGFRDAYNGPYGYSYNYIPQGLQAVRIRNRQNFGFGGWDPSRPGDFDPSLRPSD